MDFLCYDKGVNKNYRGDRMELGEKLKQARLEAGLSQRQLCGDTITRNMLSQIENGTAKPSLATLQALCARLGKPVSYFWEDAPSENLSLLHKARQADPQEALTLLKAYLSPDPMLDKEYYFLSARCCLALAQRAVEDERPGLARTLWEQAVAYGQKSGDFQTLYCREMAVLAYKVQAFKAAEVVKTLPDNTQEMLLRAQAALDMEDPEKCLIYLAAADRQTRSVRLMQGDALVKKQDYAAAADCFHALEETDPQAVYARLEACYRELGDYQKAYEYACKQR